MVLLRSRRLESLLGTSLDAITGEDLTRLVEGGAQEDFDLDFKRELYGRGDSDRRSLCGDVAAMANTAGGLIIIGIEEDENARASAAPGVLLNDAEIVRMRQVVASGVSPMPAFNVLTIPKAAGTDPTHGFIMIAVPRSADAPHAVAVNDALRYPKRNGAATRYLSEAEVASAYRDRIYRAAQQLDLVKAIEREAVNRLDLDSDFPWLFVSLTPDLAGSLQITSSTFRGFRDGIVGKSPAFTNVGAAFMRASVGRRRLLADGTNDGGRAARWASVELHTDGSGVFAIQLRDMNERSGPRVSESAPKRQMVSDEFVAVAVLSGVLCLAGHARDRAAAGGNALIRAQLITSNLAESIEIGHTRFHGIGETRSSAPQTGPGEPAEAVGPLDEIAQPGTGLVALASVLLDELAQIFGIAELGQCTRNGELRKRYWGEGWRKAVFSWADRYGIPIIDESLV